MIMCLLLQDIGTGTWREVTFHVLTATATPAGENCTPTGHLL